MKTNSSLMRRMVVLAAGVAAAFALSLAFSQPARTPSSLRASNTMVVAQHSTDGQETHG